MIPRKIYDDKYRNRLRDLAQANKRIKLLEASNENGRLMNTALRRLLLNIDAPTLDSLSTAKQETSHE